MKALFEFVLFFGSAGLAAIWVKFVFKKVKNRGYQAYFVGGPLDNEKKTVRVLTPTFTSLQSADHAGNRLVSRYKLDDSGLGIYTHVADEVVRTRNRPS